MDAVTRRCRECGSQFPQPEGVRRRTRSLRGGEWRLEAHDRGASRGSDSGTPTPAEQHSLGQTEAPTVGPQSAPPVLLSCPACGTTTATPQDAHSYVCSHCQQEWHFAVCGACRKLRMVKPEWPLWTCSCPKCFAAPCGCRIADWYSNIPDSILSNRAAYVGGHPAMMARSQTAGSLTLGRHGLCFLSPKMQIKLPLESITALGSKSLVSNNVNVAALAAFGLLALGARKTKIRTMVSVLDRQGELRFLVDDLSPLAVHNLLLPAHERVRSREAFLRGPITAASFPPVVGVKSVPPTPVTHSMAAELEKLSSLFTQNLLTAEEFQTAKQRLLKND